MSWLTSPRKPSDAEVLVMLGFPKRSACQPALVSVGLQAEMALSRYSALVLGYNGEFGSGSRDQSANVKVRWAF